ncbi:MAG: hypothetical protein K2M98_04455, partial [Muribaculum sp.]|nr:hypothetical protein [Muribaculum sp.]
LRLAVTTYRPDVEEIWDWRTDTLNFYFKPPKEVEKKKKKNKDGEEDTDSVPPIDFLTLNVKSSSTQDLYGSISLSTEQPIARIIDSGLRMEIKRDTLWDTIAAPKLIRPDSINLKKYQIDYNWEPGARYRLTVDSASVYGIYGHWNNTLHHEFSVRSAEEYSALYFIVTGLQPDERAIVELLKSDNVADTASVINGTAAFPHIMPGEYYARLYIDRNDNHKWDTGSIADSLQPEEVFYFPKKINLKKNWDVEQNWNIYETAVDKQKPEEIKKNKPKENKIRRRNPDGSYIDEPDSRDRNNYEEDEEEFGGSFFGPGYGNGSRNIGSPNSYNSNRRLR